MIYRILVTGSRDWDDWLSVDSALCFEVEHCMPVGRVPVLIHGKAKGADQLAQAVWLRTPWQMEEYPASDFPDPKVRNQHMVDLGADVCLAFALSWASGTGHCARAARRAGIPTIDLGVNTA